jgi:hypothetical protein
MLLDFIHRPVFFFKNNVSETGSASVFRQKGGEGMAPTLWGPLEIASLNHWLSQFPKRCF